jgi:hypothetical protein
MGAYVIMALMILGLVQRLHNSRSLKLDVYVECGGNAGWVIDLIDACLVPPNVVCSSTDIQS